jgi:hypothetical protein
MERTRHDIKKPQRILVRVWEIPMNYKNMFWFGSVFVLISIMGMTIAREYTVSSMVFILGMILIGCAYAKSPQPEGPAINTDQVNKNIQTFNNILWGKQEKKEDEYDTIEIKIKRKK